MEETILEQLQYEYGKTDSRENCPEEEQRIRARRGNLKKQLTKKQYRQVFRMLDDKDDIAGKMSIMNFESGVRFGVKLMTEIYVNDN